MPESEGITEVWRQSWESDPHRVLLKDAASGAQYTRGEFNAASARVAAQMSGCGVVRGDCVILSAAPSAETAVHFVALLRLGCTAVPVNTAATAREIAHVVTVSGAKAALSDAPQRFEGLVQRLDLNPEGDTTVSLPDLDCAQAHDRALICFTSGTTGAPKGAPLTHAQLLAGTRGLVECWQWSSDDILVSALPMFHVHGLLVAWAGTLTAAASMVVHPRFEAHALIDSVVNERASLLFGVPTMWSRLVETGRLAELSRLRLAVSGSAPLSPTLFARIAEGIGQAPVERYGMTETMILTSTAIDDERRAGTVGRPLPGMQVRLADDGVVEVRGNSVFDGYLIDSPTAAPVRTGFTDDGWFRTGDIGEWDGFDLRLIGRASELIITGGYNVYPREVEDVLRLDPGIADVAVVGVPDDTWGEIVTACVVANDDTGVERWSHLCEINLAPYKRPRAWHFVSELPRNAMGKVQRELLVTRILSA